MKKGLFTLLSICLSFSLIGQIDFKSGSLQLDTDLNKINANAKLDLGAFKTELGVKYDVSEKKLDYMSAKLKMQPAEWYFALEIGKHSNKPIDEVLNVYQKNKGKGWGYTAKQMGIKPGSPAFHALKNNTKGKAKKNKGHKGKGNKGKGQKGKGKKGNK